MGKVLKFLTSNVKFEKNFAFFANLTQFQDFLG